MVIRFLETVPSQNPEFPFTAGQIIHVVCPDAFLRGYIEAKKAVVVPSDDTERAIEPGAETPEPETKRGRRRAG
jgi:hypothetical protein